MSNRLTAATLLVVLLVSMLSFRGGNFAPGTSSVGPTGTVAPSFVPKSTEASAANILADRAQTMRPFETTAVRSPAVAAPGATGAANEIANAERLSIRFQGYAELTGEYRVGGDGAISIPVIGRVPVGGLGPPELEAILAERMTRMTGRETYVNVEISEYRGIFVAGYVARPGIFPWRPGMMVLHALVLAGGTFRAAGDGSSGLGDDMAIVRLQKAVAEQKRNYAAMARLEAERGNLLKIELPSKLVELVGDEQAREVIKAETSALISRRAAQEAKKAALVRATEMANRELAGLGEQAKRLKVQLSTRQSYKNKIDGLQEKGIVRAERSMDEFTRVSDLEDRSTGVAVATARVQATLAGLERDRVNLEFEPRAEVDQEIIRLGRAIAQFDIDIEAERVRYRKLTGSEPPMTLVVSEPTKKVALNYKIVRPMQQGSSTLRSDELMELRPGDILYVNLE